MRTFQKQKRQGNELIPGVRRSPNGKSPNIGQEGRTAMPARPSYGLSALNQFRHWHLENPTDANQQRRSQLSGCVP